MFSEIFAVWTNGCQEHAERWPKVPSVPLRETRAYFVIAVCVCLWSSSVADLRQSCLVNCVHQSITAVYKCLLVGILLLYNATEIH